MFPARLLLQLLSSSSLALALSPSTPSPASVSLSVNQTWDPSLIRRISAQVGSVGECRQLCEEEENCEGFTWLDHQAPVFPGSCALFEHLGSPGISCSNCFSGLVEIQIVNNWLGNLIPAPKVCTKACRGMGFEVIASEVLPSSRRRECQTRCLAEPRCHQFTNFGDRRRGRHLCTLYTNATVLANPNERRPFFGAVVVGGASEATETFPPYPGCNEIPDLPSQRIGHSLTLLSGSPPTLVLCGGTDKRDWISLDTGSMEGECLSWTKGEASWNNFADGLKMNLSHHVAWAPPGQKRVLLMEDSTTRWAPDGSMAYPLHASGSRSCGIPVGDTIILTGGGLPGQEHQNVHRYSIGGHLETLPSFMHPMAGHACGSYLNSEGQTVLMVVTQGYGEARISSSRRDRTTVLELRQGADHWTRGPGDSDWSPSNRLQDLFTGSKVNDGMTIASLPTGELLLVRAGPAQNGNNQVLKLSNGTWSENGRLKRKRGNHALAVVGLSLLCD